jgi:cell shape-determining protein MreC
MKTIYPLQNRKRTERGRFRPYVVGVIILAVVFGLILIVPNFLPSSSHKIGRPFWSVREFLGDHAGDMKAFIFSRHTLITRNNELKEQLREANTQLLSLDVYKRENDEFKKVWGRENIFNGTIAFVLSRPPQSPYDTFVLDVGSENAEGLVNVGDKVIVSDTILLGQIEEVFGKTSRAKLYSNVDTETTAIVDRTSDSVTLKGKGSGNFEINAPQELDIEAGDTIIIPGLNPNMIAKVVEIESNPASSFKRVFCQTPVNISTLNSVLVVQN